MSEQKHYSDEEIERYLKDATEHGWVITWFNAPTDPILAITRQLLAERDEVAHLELQYEEQLNDTED